MFGSKNTKAKKRHGAAFWIVGLFTFAIESMLGLNAAFLVDQSLSIVVGNMLRGTPFAGLAPLITLFAGLVVGVCFVAGGVWTFAGFMDAIADAKAYAKAYRTNNWPVWTVRALFAAIILLDFTTLCFRATFFAERGALFLFIFFLIIIALPPILGPLIYVLDNTPRDRKLTKARQYGEQLETEDIYSVIEQMDPDLRSRWLADDPTALQEHYDRVAQRRQEAYEYEQQKIQEREQTDRPLVTIPLPNIFQPKKHLTALPQQAQQSGQNQNDQRRA
jgi:hypothetical protein